MAITLFGSRLKTIAPQSPTDLGATSWFDFSDANQLFQVSTPSTPVTTDGQTVAYCDDKSAYNNHIYQPTSAREPTYKTNIKNGLSVLRFNRTTQQYLYSKLAHPQLAGTSRTQFIVYKNDWVSGDTPNIIRSRYSSNTILTGIYASNNTSFVHCRTSGGSIRSVGVNTGDGVWSIVHSDWDVANDTFKVFKNGTQAGSTITDATGDTGTHVADYVGWMYGGSSLNYFTGDIGEIVIFNKTLTDDERTAMVTWLNNKWSVF